MKVNKPTIKKINDIIHSQSSSCITLAINTKTSSTVNIRESQESRKGGWVIFLRNDCLNERLGSSSELFIFSQKSLRPIVGLWCKKR